MRSSTSSARNVNVSQTKQKTLLAIVAITVSLTGCLRLPAPRQEAYSLLVSTDSIMPNGVAWDWGGEIAPVVGLAIVPGLTVSTYPDIALLTIDETGAVAEYNGGKGSTGHLQSSCPDKLLCRYLIEHVPKGYFAIVAIDLDDINSPDFIGALIFTDINRGDADGDRVTHLEEKVRAWLNGKVDAVPDTPLEVVYRDACREDPCDPDPEVSSATFAITAIEMPSAIEQEARPGEKK
jgi:hypothetical protein